MLLVKPIKVLFKKINIQLWKKYFIKTESTRFNEFFLLFIQVLGDAWTGELLEWKIRSPLMQSLSVFPRIPMLPIMTIMCIFLPNHSLVRKWKTPVNKMISRVASYLIFLIILFLESNLDKRNQKRGPPNSGTSIL